MQGQDVTVTITNWNGRHYLDDCIESVRRQTVAPKEIILCDNASTDGSVAWVKARYPDVRVVALDRNEGPCPARNAGLREARTPWVFALDNDAVLEPDCLERLLIHANADTAIVQPRSVFFAETDRVHYDGADMHYVGMMTLHHFYAPIASADSAPRDIDACIAVALLMDRTKILEAGAYDAAHFILFEDHDLSYRVRARGWRIIREPHAIVRHKEGTAGISFRKARTYAPKRVYLHSRNRWITLLKNHRLRTLVLTSPALFVYDLAYLFFALKNRSLGAYLKGKWDCLGLLPHILRERRAVQSTRVLRDRDLLKSDPLTISPLIERRGLVARMQSAMDVFFAIWWKIVRRLT